LEAKRVFWLLRGKHGIPDLGRSFTVEPQSIQGELIFVDTAEQFYASDRDRGRFEVLEAKHRPRSRLDAAVILFDHPSSASRKTTVPDGPSYSHQSPKREDTHSALVERLLPSDSLSAFLGQRTSKGESIRYSSVLDLNSSFW
jgi:RecA-family ATPase